MTEMDALREQIKPGWTVKIIDHDYGNDSRDDVTVEQVASWGMTLRPKKPWSSQGRSFPTMTFPWNGEGKEVSGLCVRLYHTPPPHTGKSRRLVKAFVFSPPHETWRAPLNSARG